MKKEVLISTLNFVELHEIPLRYYFHQEETVMAGKKFSINKELHK